MHPHRSSGSASEKASDDLLDIQTFRERFDPQLHTYIDTQIATVTHLTTQADIHRMFDHLHAYISGGKRLRPYAAYCLYHIFGGHTTGRTNTIDDDTLISLLVLIELFHIYLLIQDDIIDHATTRHNVPTYHHYIHSCEPHKDAHYAASQTYILCDLINSRCMQLLFGMREQFGSMTNDYSGYDRAQESFLATMNEVGIGQMLDIYHMNSTTASYDAIIEKTFWKTATYSFIRPMLFGYYLTGRDESSDLALIHTLGKHRGIAFQIRDDLADVIEYDNHKTPFGDLIEGGQTIFTHHIMTHGTSTQRETLQALMGHELSEPDKAARRAIVSEMDLYTLGQHAVADELGCIGPAIIHYLSQHSQHTDLNPINDAALTQFSDAITLLLGRLGDYRLFPSPPLSPSSTT